jgi:ADP-ribose pyrophosphatase YjhB (NUDIX family)
MNVKRHLLVLLSMCLLFTVSARAQVHHGMSDQNLIRDASKVKSLLQRKLPILSLEEKRAVKSKLRELTRIIQRGLGHGPIGDDPHPQPPMHSISLKEMILAVDTVSMFTTDKVQAIEKAIELDQRPVLTQSKAACNHVWQSSTKKDCLLKSVSMSYDALLIDELQAVTQIRSMCKSIWQSSDKLECMQVLIETTQSPVLIQKKLQCDIPGAFTTDKIQCLEAIL